VLLRDGHDKENNPKGAWASSLGQRIALVDAKGNKYQVQQSRWDSTSPSNARGELTFINPRNGPLGPPVKLVYSIWVTMQYAVPFEFKDLPLP
jgi:hypothetical protein